MLNTPTGGEGESGGIRRTDAVIAEIGLPELGHTLPNVLPLNNISTSMIEHESVQIFLHLFVQAEIALEEKLQTSKIKLS